MSRYRPLEKLLLSLALLAVAGSPPAHAQDPRPLTAADLEGVSWRSVGPANVGGRVSAIALVPGSRRSFYVGYGTGGVFKTDNLGVTFTPVFDATGVASIGAIAVADAPADWPGWTADDKAGGEDLAERGKGRIVWVGTGEGNGRNSSSWGRGVFRSTDGGASFEPVGLEESHDIPRLAVDPRDPDVCYVAALGHLWGANPERGVYKTADGGETWQHVLALDEDTGASDVVLDPRDPDVVYAGLYARRRTAWSFTGNSEKGGIFRSDDGGATWRKLTAGLPPRTGRIGLTAYPRTPHSLYAVVESDYGGSGRSPWEDRSPSGGLFRSRDRGDTWERLSDFSFRPFYFSRVAVDPEDEKRIYLPGWDLAISDDGGKTFRRSGSEHVHVDFHAIVVNPLDTDQILVGTDGGVYLSHDRGSTWDYLNHVAAGQFYRISADDSDPYRIAGGLQDNGSLMGPSETFWQTEDEAKDGILSRDWMDVGGGDGFTVAFDPTDENLIYTTSQGGYLVRTRLDNQLRKLIRPSENEGGERLRYNWDAPFLVSRHDPTVLYHAGNKVFKLTERGDFWFAISPDLSRDEPAKTATVGSDAETYGTVVSLAESPLEQGLLWAGTDDGRIHVTRDEGGSWSEVTPAEVGGLYVAEIVASQHAAEVAYAAVDGHRSDDFAPRVLATRDLGTSWRAITSDLPAAEPVRSLAEDPRNASVLYAGTELGLYVTIDGGASWIRMNGESLPPAPVADVMVHERERDLIVGTHGRSAWILDDAGFFAQLTPEVRSRPLAVFEVRPATPRQVGSRVYGAGHGLFRAKNPPRGAAIDFWVREATGKKASISIADARGFEIRSLSAAVRAGINRVVWDLQADAKHRFDGVDQDWPSSQIEVVPAGDYEVTVTLGGESAKTTVTVQPAPAWGPPPDGGS